MTSRRQGVTLIELLVVISVLGMLMGVLTPVIQIATKMANRTNTQSLLRKVDAGLRSFKQDIGVYPYLEYDTSLPDFGTTGNALAFHLTRQMTTSELSLLKADLVEARGAYDTTSHRLTVTSPVVVAAHGDAAARPGLAMVLNRMGRERASLMVNAGCSQITGVGSLSAIRILTAGKSKGWGGDYLDGEIATRNIKGDAIVDNYGLPLLYVCPVICGLEGSWVAPSVIDGNSRSVLIRADRFGFEAQGRSEITVMGSDIRTTAASAYRFEFEVWSFGADRRADPDRSARANADNIPASAYNKGLVP